MGDRRVLFRLLVGLNVALFVVYAASIVMTAQSGQNPWAGMALFWLVPVAVIVLGGFVLLAAVGLAAPIALFDLAAAWYMLLFRTPITIAIAVGAVLASAAGVMLQGIALRDWLNKRSDDSDAQPR